MQHFIERIHDKNLIHHQIIQKKRTLAKLEYIPEAIEECQTLQKEIKELEDQLAMMQ